MSGPEQIGSEQMWPDDLSGVAATDALLDDLAAGRPVPVDVLDDGDAALSGLLSTWRAELDDRAATVMTPPPVDLPPRPSRWIRAHQRTAAATAVVVAIAASGGVAAAASGPTGPLGGLHKLIWGPPAVHHLDTLAASVNALLDKAEQQINTVSQVGSITAAAHDRIAGELTKAASLLARDPLRQQSMVERLGRLRTTLAGIPLAVPTPTTVTDHHRHGPPGNDDNQGGDRHGGNGGGEDNQGDSNSAGDDNQGSDSQDSGSQDSGSQSGGSDDGSGSSSGDQSGGSDDGSGSGGDGQSGGDSGDQTQISGSSDGGSSSGGDSGTD